MPEPITQSPPENAHTLREWASLAAAGDDQAFERIHRRFGGGLMRFFLTRNGGRVDLAEELAQKTWVEVWRALRRQRYDPQRGAISTFTYAIAYKIWLQYCRTSLGGRARANAAEGYLSMLIEESSAPDDLLNAAELLDALRACLREAGSPNALDDDERLIVLHAAGGRSERWLADELGLAASTINARKKLIYNKLRKCLSAKGFVRDDAERGRNPGG
jgi:RNA polymerase sigma factor (sigma-70 family)